jgi:hypothetical protein
MSGFRCSVADLGEGHSFAFFAGVHTLKGSSTRIPANHHLVSFDEILEPIARHDAQGLANLSWNRRLPLASHCGMRHRAILTVQNDPYILIFPCLVLGKTTPRFAFTKSASQHDDRVGDR